MSKSVYVLYKDVDGDIFHKGFCDFLGVYGTLDDAKTTADHYDLKKKLRWEHDEYGGIFGQSAWTAKIKKGIIAVIEDCDVGEAS